MPACMSAMKKFRARRGLSPRCGEEALLIPGSLDHDAIKWNRIMISSLCLSMISAQTRFAFVARENRFPLFRIMPWKSETCAMPMKIEIARAIRRPELSSCMGTRAN